MHDTPRMLFPQYFLLLVIQLGHIQALRDYPGKSLDHNNNLEMYKAKSASLAQHFYHGGTSARSQGLDDTCRRGSKKCNTCEDKILKRKTRLIALFEKFIKV